MMKENSLSPDATCPYRKSRSSYRIAANRAMLSPMGDILKLTWWTVIGLFRARVSLEAEILVLPPALCTAKKIAKAARFQQFQSPGVCQPLLDCTTHCECIGDRAAGDGHPLASCGFPLVLAMEVAASPRQAKGTAEIRRLIREMSLANPVWGAPRIHGELLKLGIEIGQTSVAKYMARMGRPPSQGWKTFLRNHADGIASLDLFVVPTLSF
jgi:hypothetical protein